MPYRGPCRSIRISGLDPARNGYFITLADTGREIFIPEKMILNEGPRMLIIPEWYYKKEIQRVDGAKADQVPI